MRVIVYADFNCPYSYLASQRVDALVAAGRAEVEWRAVEHDPRLSMTGTPTGADPGRWQRELAHVTALARPGEQPPAEIMPLISNTHAAVSGYAEAVTDGVPDQLRRALFDAIWVRHEHLSSAYDVRPLIAGVTYPPQPVRSQLGLELPRPGLGNPDPSYLTRVLGGTIGYTGAPLTTTGWRRVQSWRRAWLALDRQVVPTVIDPTGTAWSGVHGLAYLADLLADRPAPVAAPPTLGEPARQLVAVG